MIEIETNHSLDTESPVSFSEFVEKNPIVKKAYEWGSRAHQNQKRKDGSPYFTHCEAVARIIYEEWNIVNEPEKIAAALLHDTVEDTNLTLTDIKDNFSEEIAYLVDGVSKFKSDKSNGDKETVRKIFDRTLINPWVALLKLADRLHNMRTLDYMSPEKRVSKAKETIGYAKLAESLGMWKVMVELEDLSLKYSQPEEYKKFSDLVSNDPRTSELFLGHMTSKLDSIVRASGINATITTQINGLARLRHKMIREHRFSRINDVVSFRIITEDTPSHTKALNDAQIILGQIWNNFGDIEDSSRFDNFIYLPRDNGYSAMQVTLDYPFTSGKKSIEIAITTRQKENHNNDGVVSLIRSGQKDISDYALKLIFTPTGEVKFFKPEATGYDFAYSIEKFMGAQATGILINGVEHPISTIIPNAATVEVLVGPPRVAPDREAVNYVMKPAKRMIEDQFADLEDQQTIARGKEMIKDVLADHGLFDLYDLIKYKKHANKVTSMLRSLGCKRYVSNLYRMIGLGQIDTEDFKKAMVDFGLTREELKINSILLEGKDVKNILGFIGKTIGKYGGNIKPMINEPFEEGGSENFTATLLVEDLPEKYIKNLKNAFLKNPAIKKVTVV